MVFILPEIAPDVAPNPSPAAVELTTVQTYGATGGADTQTEATSFSETDAIL